MAPYLLSLFAAVFIGNCESSSQDPGSVTAVNLDGQISCNLIQLVYAHNETTEENTPERKESPLAFVENDAFPTEVAFTLGEKFEGSIFEVLFVQLIEQEILPVYERTCSVKLPNQPTLVALKVILQV